jgi:alpha-glucosidase
MTARQVYLPSGSWYDWHTSEHLGGHAFVLTPTPMDRIPIYARGGAIIPMWPEAPPSTDGHHPAAVELHLFVPLADGTYRSFLQEDDGVTYAADGGAYVRTSLLLTRAGSRVVVDAEVTGDGYPQFARTEFHLVLHGAPGAQVRLDNAAVEGVESVFVLPNRGHGFVVEVELEAT